LAHKSWNPTDEEFMDMLDTSDNQNNSENLEDGAVGGVSGSGCADGGSSSTISSYERRRLAIQRSLQSVAHASQCRDISCCFTSCHEMKRVLQSYCIYNSGDRFSSCWFSARPESVYNSGHQISSTRI